jgi:orotidine-5'-phosphate decarboxylase
MTVDALHTPETAFTEASPVTDALFVALDVETAEAALALVKQLKPLGIRHFKVGMSLFYQEGFSLLRALDAEGCHVFLDLKLHDIPSTVARTVTALVTAHVRFLNVHAQGGLAMMQAAKQAATETAKRLGKPSPVVIGVTVLTSFDDPTWEQASQRHQPLQQSVLQLATLAQQAGLDGVVCSPQEVSLLRENLPPGFQLVTPGVRLLNEADLATELGDQVRVMTPAKALQAGATALVVGRPIYAADDPAAAAQAILASMAEGKTA